MNPMQPINYQGTYSWLYDIGWLFDGIGFYANKEGWSELTTLINNSLEYLDKAIITSWRDGCEYPSYYSYDKNESNSTSWLVNSNHPYNYYGLTISGETFAARIEGDTAYIINGNYPSWYTELAFGRNCKWNDLLKALYPAE